jgi:hypothetical protein
MPDAPRPIADPPWRCVGWTIRVRDDRGVLFPCRGIREHRWWGLSGLPANEQRASGMSVFTEHPAAGIAVALLTGVGTPGVFFFLTTAFDHPVLPFWMSLVLILTAGVGFSLAVQRFTMLRWNAERALVDARKRFLADGRCLACGYAIRDVKPEPDGCSICPECAAAWRIDHPA